MVVALPLTRNPHLIADHRLLLVLSPQDPVSTVLSFSISLQSSSSSTEGDIVSKRRAFHSSSLLPLSSVFG